MPGSRKSKIPTEAPKSVDEKEREVGVAALEVLTKQFRNPFDFLRELIQNALDAGTPVVEVWMTFTATEGERGVAEIHVDDFGDGMNEQIIDNELTRLFSSTKEDDRTKIGKFGIGFVSVFAIRPDGVMVRTSRGGENWEVFFHNDGTFEKTAVDRPVDGTKVTLFKAMSRREYGKSVATALETIRFWCKHAEKKITFQDRAGGASPGPVVEHPFAEGAGGGDRIIVNEPLGVTGFCPVVRVLDGTEVAMAFTTKPLYGFYNKGLTLCESSSTEVIAGYEKFFQFVTFKIKSHYLEHTLTRDTILRDANYRKALDILVDTARGDLVMALLGGIEQRAALKTMGDEDRAWYLKAMQWLCELPAELDPTFTFKGKMEDLRANVGRAMMLGFRRPKAVSIDADKMTLFRLCDGSRCTLEAVERSVKKSGGVLMVSPEANALTEAIRAEGFVVFLLQETPANVDFFVRHVPALRGAREGWPVVCSVFDCFWLLERKKSEALDETERRFVEGLGRALQAAGAGFAALRAADCSLGEPSEDRLGWIVREGAPFGCSLPGFFTKKKAKPKEELVLHRQDRPYGKLLDLFGRAPELALVLAVERLMLEGALAADGYQEAVSAIYAAPMKKG